jgi:hypothetical protein
MRPLFRYKSLDWLATEKKVIVSESPIALKTVKSPLIEPMFHTYIGTLSGVFVVLADSGMGKSEAAMYFMKSLRPQSSDRGIMVGGESHQRYGRQLATKTESTPVQDCWFCSNSIC